MWILIAAGIVVAVIAGVARRRAATDSGLGWVTERWLTDYRANQAADSNIGR